jgi:hypothetical protein
VQEWSVLVSSLLDWRRKSWYQIFDVKRLENDCPLIIAKKGGKQLVILRSAMRKPM